MPPHVQPLYDTHRVTTEQSFYWFAFCYELSDNSLISYGTHIQRDKGLCISAEKKEPKHLCHLAFLPDTG